MGMSFQGPPPPPPPFWREPAMWVAVLYASGALAVADRAGGSVKLAALLSGALAVAAYIGLRVDSAREDRRRQLSGMLKRRGGD